MRVLHGPVNVGNQPWVLSRHERDLGIRSDLVISYGTWLKYSADRILGEIGKDRFRSFRRRLFFGLSAPFRYDVLHYYFGRSYLSWEDVVRHVPGRFFDLKLAKWLRRKVFMTLQGCDVRLSDLSSEWNEVSMCQPGRCSVSATCRATLDAQRRGLIERILPYCDRVFVLNPELAHFVPGATFLPYASVDVESFEPTLPRTDGPIRLLHAPSDPAIKGSQYLLDAVDRLKQRWPIELILVQKLPHEEALKQYQRADIVIDQLLAGWYGGFAVEAMAMGKPVGCYIRERDLVHVPPAMREDLAVLRLNPQTIEADLEQLFRRRHEWPNLGRRARDFVLQWHHPRKIAEAMIQAYQDPQSRFTLTGEQQRCAA